MGGGGFIQVLNGCTLCSLTFRRHPGQLGHLHVEVPAVRLVLDLAVVHGLQDLPLLGLKARQSRLQVHLLLL